MLASSSVDIIKLWDPSTGELYQTLEGRSGPVQSLAFSPDSQLLAFILGKSIKLWDPNTGELRYVLHGHLNSVLSLAFSYNSQLLASSSYDKTVKLWNPNTGELCQTLEGHSDLVRSVAFSPDGQLLASGSHDTTIKLWDLRTGGLRQTLDNHEMRHTFSLHYLPALSVLFSPDGQLLVSTFEKTTKLWDPSTGELRQTLEGHSDLVWTGNNTQQLSILENQWIFFHGRMVLWLPSNYRPTCLAFKAGVLALGHSSGQVSFISTFT